MDNASLVELASEKRLERLENACRKRPRKRAAACAILLGTEERPVSLLSSRPRSHRNFRGTPDEVVKHVFKPEHPTCTLVRSRPAERLRPRELEFAALLEAWIVRLGRSAPGTEE
jgi:hypothetical protein